jgi:protein-tyrosine phosphatase
MIRDRLMEKGIDPAHHVPQRLTRELLDRVDLTIAMGLDHRDFLRRHFRHEAILFNQVCYQIEEPILDIHEVVPNWEADPYAARKYACWVIDYVWEAMPAFITRLPELAAARTNQG